MSITDELREYALGWDEGNRVRRDLTAIADRIDAEHEAKVSYWRGASYRDGYDEGFASALAGVLVGKSDENPLDRHADMPDTFRVLNEFNPEINIRTAKE